MRESLNNEHFWLRTSHLVLHGEAAFSSELLDYLLPPLSLSTRVNITFLLLRPTTGDPMTSSEVLVVLDETRARDKLNDTIYRTERFTAVATSDGSSPQNSELSLSLFSLAVPPLPFLK